MKGKYLITTDEWFQAPDGQSYKAVWGNVEILEDNALGIKTNRNATNWYAKVGDDSKHIIIAGCQIHYAVRCEEKPELHKCKTEDIHEGKVHNNEVGTRIYLAE